MNPVLTLDHIFISRSGRDILSDISLTVDHGEHWAVLGPNGSGKTTLMNIITAYLWPMEGTVTVLGDRYGAVDIREKRRHIGLVSSALFERVPPRETLLDVVISGRYASLGIYGEPDPYDFEKAGEIVSFLHCESIKHNPYGALSFGERQRALIGRALMAVPQLLILDEPCEGLDMNARELILNRLDALAADPAGPAMLLVTHRVEEIPPGFTHALILKDGRILASGLKHEVITSGNLSAAMEINIEVMHRNGRLYAVVG
ncbi:MAG: ABC transporter ATP-binding protein [Candidatus Latescibacteria bacterium]|nr:ABC transporter ATP-binding protein [Candidatus Latescibacterota bacterium]